jgi:hypothetical protein
LKLGIPGFNVNRDKESPVKMSDWQTVNKRGSAFGNGAFGGARVRRPPTVASVTKVLPPVPAKSYDELYPQVGPAVAKAKAKAKAEANTVATAADMVSKLATNDAVEREMERIKAEKAEKQRLELGTFFNFKKYHARVAATEAAKAKRRHAADMNDLYMSSFTLFHVVADQARGSAMGVAEEVEEEEFTSDHGSVDEVSGDEEYFSDDY